MAIDRTHMHTGVITDTQVKDASLKYTDLETDTIQLEIPIEFWSGYLSFAIDSTGTKITTHRYLISEELVKHLKHAYFEAAVTDFTATDATVNVVLRNNTDAVDVLYISISSDTMRTRTGDIVDDVKALAGKEVSVEVRVATASATSGATAAFRNARLVLVLGVS